MAPAQRYQRNDETTTTSLQDRVRPPSVASDFGDDFGDNYQRPFARSNTSILTGRKQQYGQQQQVSKYFFSKILNFNYSAPSKAE